MSIFRVSVLGLILLVAVTAVGLAALASPSNELANGLFTFTGGCLLFALLATMYRDGSRRAFWVGFSVFGWGYLLACYGPFVGSAIRARLLTTTLIDRLYAQMNPALGVALEEISVSNPDWLNRTYQWHIRFDQETDPQADNVALTAIGSRSRSELSIAFYPPPTCSNLVWFRRSAQAIAILWVACLGGFAGRLLESTRRIASRASSSPRPRDEASV
jgi:hypothetical protein